MRELNMAQQYTQENLNPFSIFERSYRQEISSEETFDLLRESARTGDIRKTQYGDNIIHWLVNDEKPSLYWIKNVLDLCPELANQKNSAGLYPHEAILAEDYSYHKLATRGIKRVILPYLSSEPVKQKLAYNLGIKLSLYLGENKQQTILFDKPTLLCFGGYGSWHKHNADGISKLFTRILNVDENKKQPFQVVSVQYPGEKEDLENDLKYWDLPESSTLSPAYYINDMVENYFMPLLQDETGHRLPCINAQKNMRAVNIVAYSYGGEVAYLTEQQLTKRMDAIGYSTTETDKILKQVFMITFGSALPLETHMTSFTAIHIINNDDPIIDSQLGKNIANEYGYSKDNIRIVTGMGRPNEKFVIIKKIPLKNFLMPNGTKKDTRLLNLCGHDDLAYLSTGTEPEHKFMSVLRYALLTNTMNNSIQNARSDNFKELESFYELFDFPKKSLFPQLSPVPGFTCRNMTAIGKKIDYIEKLKNSYIYSPYRIDSLNISHKKMVQLLTQKYLHINNR